MSTPSSHDPSRRDRFRPLELLLMSAIVAIFIGLIAWMTTRQPEIALIFGGIGFIVSVVVFAMLALASKPTSDERIDLDEQDRDSTS